MSRPVSVVLTLVLLSIAQARWASAQDRAVSAVLPDLVDEAAQIGRPYDLPFDTGHDAHFAVGSLLISGPAALNAALALQLATLPIGPVSADAVHARDGAGAFLNGAFGTSYSGRGLSLGRGRWGAAVTFQNSTFGGFEDIDLRGGGINFFFGHSQCCPEGVNDVLQETVYLRIHRKVTSFVVNYGAASRFDVGFVVPIVQVGITGRVLSRIVHATTTGGPTHAFDRLGRATRTTYLDVDLRPEAEFRPIDYGTPGRTARGLGDVGVRGKLVLVRGEATGLAATLDLSLPTGSAEDFLGAGSVRLKPGLAWSAAFGPVSPHVSGAYTWSRGELSAALQDAFPTQPLDLTVPDEIEFTAGVNIGVAPRVTLVAETIGRRVLDVQRFTRGDELLGGRRLGDGSALVTNGRGDLNQVFATVGGRINLGGSVFANVGVFLPVAVDGLEPNASVAASFNYGF